MSESAKQAQVRYPDRINLRLSPDSFRAIDELCSTRPGHVSRNTWICEAVEEKLARDRSAQPQRQHDGRRRA